MALPPFLGTVVNFLRAGYPEGVPPQDYIPLLALLRRQLSSDEVEQIDQELAATGDSSSAAAIRAAISDVTHEAPLESDIARVSAPGCRGMAAGVAAPREHATAIASPSSPSAGWCCRRRSSVPGPRVALPS